MSNRLFAYLVGVAAFAWIAPAAVQAAPAAVAGATAHKTVTVEKVANRVRPRSTKRPRVYGWYKSFGPTANPAPALPFTYGMAKPHEVPFGSNAWWRSMTSTGHIR